MMSCVCLLSVLQEAMVDQADVRRTVPCPYATGQAEQEEECLVDASRSDA